MVLLSMTKLIVDALASCALNAEGDWDSASLGPGPSLDDPKVGKPISHAQVLATYRQLGIRDGSITLDELLRGSEVWLEPPKPKAEPTDEFKELMARLRAEQETQSYARMLSTSPHPSHSLTPGQSFAQRFPTSPYASLFPDSTASLPSRLASAGQVPSHLSSDRSESVVYDDASFATVNRQLALIGNVLISIVATAVAIWWATWHWSTTARLGISMGGSSLVGVAEVVVYLGYIQRLDNAKLKENKKKERKKVTKTWVIEGRKGAVEKRLKGESDGSRSENPHTAVATGSWPEVPGAVKQRGIKWKT